MSMPWLRLYTEIIDDEKVRLLAFEDRWHYIAALCLKRKGLLEESDTPLRDRKIAIKLGLSADEVQKAKQRLMEVGLVDKHWQPCGWDQRQYHSDCSTGRVQKFRAKQKRSVSETPPDTETDEDAVPRDENPEVQAPLSPDDVASKSMKGPPSCPHQAIIGAYHELLPELPQVRALPEHRRRLLAGRWREESKRQNLEWWRNFFTVVSESDFLCGRSEPSQGRPPFHADLEWLIRPTNFLKVLEGRYDHAK